MAITPVDDASWTSIKLVTDGQTGDAVNINKAVDALREEVNALWEALWGDIASASRNQGVAIINQTFDGSNSIAGTSTVKFDADHINLTNVNLSSGAIDGGSLSSPTVAIDNVVLNGGTF